MSDERPVRIPVLGGRCLPPIDQADGAVDRDTGYSAPRWTFDGEVARVFDDMLARSIPRFEDMRRAVFEIGSRFVQPGTRIVDLGASRGGSLAPFVDRFRPSCELVAVECSPPMLGELIRRFETEIRERTVRVVNFDLRRGYPPGAVQASLTLAVLTLQFTPINYRHRILRDAYRSTDRGGAFILVEKVLGSDALLDETLGELYHERKVESGYTAEDVERKRLALEGVLVPVTARWNEELLGAAGFDHVECFWRELNFAAWVAVRE